MVKNSKSRPRMKMTGGGTGLVNHAGARLLADLADKVGLTAGLSAAMAPTKQRRRGHDRGRVLVDLAVAIADGATTISDLAVLRNQPDLFGDVASHATAWRTLQAIDADTLDRIRAARAEARRRAWAAGADPGFYVIDIDGTLVNSHSEKESAAPNYKKRFGFYPITSFLDATGEALAGLLRPGNAGSNTAVDNIAVLDNSLAQLPIDPADVEVIARTDAAGMTHKYLDACRDRHVRFISGHELSAEIANVLITLPKRRWQPAISADGTEWRDYAHVAEITDLVDLTGWPAGCRMIARREPCHPGAQLTFTDIDGHRYQVCITDLDDPDVAYLEALYRGRGRAERQIADLKDTGLTNLPSHIFTINQAWIELCHIAQDLLAWTRLLALEPQETPGDDLTSAEPKRMRYCLLHTAGQIATTGRRRYCRLADTWPWTRQLIAAFRTHPPTSTPLLTESQRSTGSRGTHRSRQTRTALTADPARPHTSRSHRTTQASRPGIAEPAYCTTWANSFSSPGARPCPERRTAPPTVRYRHVGAVETDQIMRGSGGLWPEWEMLSACEYVGLLD